MKPVFVLIFLAVSLNFIGINAQNTSVKADTSSVHIVEKMKTETSIIDGAETWKRYLETYLRFMVPSDNGAPIGKYTVIVQFIVDEKGNVSDVKALTNFGYGMEEEVVRLIKEGPKWSPAFKDGQPVKAYRKQPVTFVVFGDGIEIDSEKPYELYIGIDNMITIKADNVNDEDIEVTISQGDIVRLGDGKFKVRISKPGNAIITVFNAAINKKELGAAYYFTVMAEKKTTN